MRRKAHADGDLAANRMYVEAMLGLEVWRTHSTKRSTPTRTNAATSNEHNTLKGSHATFVTVTATAGSDSATVKRSLTVR